MKGCDTYRHREYSTLLTICATGIYDPYVNQIDIQNTVPYMKYIGAHWINTTKHSHNETFTQLNIHTTKLSHNETFTQRNFHTTKYLHNETFMWRKIHTMKHSHNETFTQRNIHTTKYLHNKILHTVTFTPQNIH